MNLIYRNRVSGEVVKTVPVGSVKSAFDVVDPLGHMHPLSRQEFLAGEAVNVDDCDTVEIGD